MELIGKYSIASALRWLLGVANVFVVIGGVLTLILFAFALADPSLGAGLLDGMEGRPADPSHILHWSGALVFLGGALACGFTWWIINRLRRILLSVNQGDAFEFANVKRLQAVGLGLIGLQLVNLALVVAATLGEGALNRSLNLGAWLGILVVFILAEVFRQGAAMRDEQLTTV